jgi:galacturonosyltransferase
MACRIKHVKYIANVTGLGTSIENGGVLSCVSKTLYRVGLKKAECVFFQNQNNKSLFENRRITKGKNRLISGSGVNLETHFYEPYPDDHDGLRFLFVGRLMKDKGIEELIDALRRIHKEYNGVKIDIVGRLEEDYTRLINEAEKECAVTYHGEQTDMHKFYKDCHCVVLPSYHEGMANVLLEASATGRPVIASDIPGCRETFDEGVTGIGCAPRDSDSLYDAMKRFVALPREKREDMGIEARKKMEREFDRKLVIDAYLEEIAEAIGH